MTKKVLNTENLVANLIFLLIPICTLVEFARFSDLYKSLRLALLLCIICTLYKFFIKVENISKTPMLLNVSGLIITSVSALFVDNSYTSWIFLFGIILSAVSGGYLASIMSIFSYIIIVTLFSAVTPEFVANSLLASIITILVARYYSDFISVLYCIIIAWSIEISFFFILNGYNIEELLSKENIIKFSTITSSIVVGWIVYYLLNKNRFVKAPPKEPLMLDEVVSKTHSLPPKKRFEPVNYSIFLSNETPLFVRIKESASLYNSAKLNSFLVREISHKLELNEELSEVGAFYSECGRLVSNNYIKEGIKLAIENNLPPEVVTFIKEHNFKVGTPHSKETAITMIVSKFLSTIEYLDKNGLKHSRVHVVDGVTDSCLMAGKLNASGITTAEYKLIKDYLMEVNHDYFN